MATGKTDESGQVAAQKNQSRPSNLCCYSQRVCNLEKLKGFDFCHKHILEDKASPFKPCDFYAKSNDRRCMNPAPKLHDKEKSYCIIHTRKAELRRAVERRRKKRRRDSNAVEEDEEESTTEKRKRTSSNASQKSVDSLQKDEEGHSSDEELGMDLGIGGSLKVDSAWHGDVDSDAESVDSEEEDILRHAGVWTLDEASKICCDKMVRLKSLYVAQYKRLFHVLKEKRRKYLQVIQAEQENESGENPLNPSEILRSPAHRKRHGVEAILHKQAKEKRHGVTRHQGSSHQRCTHIAEGVRCPNRILPLTKYCIHHISHDPNQLLFQSCSFKTGDQKTCTNMVPKIYPFSACQLHVTLQPEPTRTDVKTDLEEAKKRDEEKRASEKQKKKEAVASATVEAIPPIHQVIEKQLPIPKALQQKSSALIPPPVPVTKETSSTQDKLPTIKVSSVTTLDTKPSTLNIEKMEVDASGFEGLLPKVGASSDSTPMEILSPASVDSPAGFQNISPTLLAASLAAVCSEAPSSGVTSPLEAKFPPSDSTVSAPSSDSKTMPVSTTMASFASSASSTSTSATSSGLTSVTFSKSGTPKDSVVASSSSTLSTGGDLPPSVTNSGDIICKDDLTKKSINPAEMSSISESKAISITATIMPNTAATATLNTDSTTLNTDKSEASSIKTDKVKTHSLTDSVDMSATLTSTPTNTSQGPVSAADSNPTAAAPTVTNTSRTPSDSVSGLSLQTTPKESQTASSD